MPYYLNAWNRQFFPRGATPPLPGNKTPEGAAAKSMTIQDISSNIVTKENMVYAISSSFKITLNVGFMDMFKDDKIVHKITCCSSRILQGMTLTSALLDG